MTDTKKVDALFKKDCSLHHERAKKIAQIKKNPDATRRKNLYRELRNLDKYGTVVRQQLNAELRKLWKSN